MPALLGTRRVPYLGGAWTPARLPGLVLWLDAATVGQADNTSVARWRDRSGRGNDAVQATVAHQPTYRAAGLAGFPGVGFDGVDDNLVGGALALSGMSFFAVAQITATTANAGVVLANDGVVNDFSAGNTMLAWDTGNAASAATGIDARWRGVTGPSNLATTYLGVVQLVSYVVASPSANNITQKVYRNGALLSATGPTAGAVASAPTQYAIGCRLTPAVAAPFLTGLVGAVLVYGGALADGQRHQVEGYLAAKYQIAAVQS